jgi:hypothetical protein
MGRFPGGSWAWILSFCSPHGNEKVIECTTLMQSTIPIYELLKRTLILISLAIWFAFLPCDADEYVESKSPDGSLLCMLRRGDKQPFPQSDAVIERATRKVIIELDRDALYAPDAKLVWSADSKRFAYVRETNQDPHTVGTRVFQRNGATFDEIKLPDLPQPKLPSQASRSERDRVYIKPVRGRTPLRWSSTTKLSPMTVGGARKRFHSSSMDKVHPHDRQDPSGTGVDLGLFSVAA